MAGRYALIVANDDYEDPKLRQLRGPVKDAEALARVLADPAIGAFEVDLVMNEPQHLLRRKVNRFFEGRRRDDTLLLHFSCHGLKDDSGQLYFATTDTEVAHLEDSALESDWVRKRLDASRSNKIVVLLDCCFSGAFTGNMRSRAGDAAHPIEPLEGKGRVVLTASSALEFSWEGDTLSGEPTPSVFTSALVRGLETGEADLDCDNWIAIGELYEYIYERIMESGAKQTPVMDSNVQGELLVAKSRREPPAVPLPLDMTLLLDSPLMTVRMTLVADLSALMQEGGAQAPAARDALERLRDDDDSSIRVRDAAATALAEVAQHDAVAAAQPASPAHLAHADAVLAVAFSLDASTLVSACRDNSARAWDVENACERGRFAHDDWVIACALSPDGQLLATACRDHSVRVWNLHSGSEQTRVTYKSVVWAVAFSPDGGVLAIAGADATVRLCDVGDGRERECIPHDGAVTAVRFSSDGRRLATTAQHGRAHVWDLVAGNQEAALTTDAAMLAVAFDDMGRALAAGGGADAARVWDIGQCRELVALEHGCARAIAFGRARVVTAADDGTARVWDLGSGSELARLGDLGRIRAVAIAPDGRRVAVAAGGGGVALWSLART